MRCRRDANHEAWKRFHPRIEQARLIWSPWTHFEVFNSLRQLTLGGDAGLSEPEVRQLISSFDSEVKAGYYDLAIVDWRDELRECRELSTRFGFKMSMRSGDVVQVAIARLSGADAFVTCDIDQHALAEMAGLESWCVTDQGRKHQGEIKGHR